MFLYLSTPSFSSDVTSTGQRYSDVGKKKEIVEERMSREEDRDALRGMFSHLCGDNKKSAQ